MAAKVKRILVNTTFFDSGIPKWEAGKHYPVTEDTERLVKTGIAEEIEVDAKDLPDAQQLDLGDEEASNGKKKK